MNVFDYFFDSTHNLEKDFVLGSKETISFKDLYNDSLKIASFLKETIGDGQNVILISPNSVFFLTAYLGIMKSGNTCIPLNFAIEQGNLDHILKTTGCSTVFLTKGLKSKLEFNPSIRLIDENESLQVLASQKIIDFNISHDEKQVAEIIFTSGSTGEPKGVMISHQNIIANTNSIIDYLKLSSKDIMAVVMPFYYCYGLSLFHTHLKVGGSIVLNNTFMFIGTVLKDLVNYKCTGFAGVPSHFQMLLKKSKTFKTTLFPDLKYVTQAGGKLHNVFIEEFVEAFAAINFYVMYGQTEATARLTYLPPELVKTKLGSIGKAIPGIELKIVDDKGSQVTVGNEGELIAKGENIMVGYYKDLIATEKTVKDGWLYTGDIAKVDEDGFLYLVARKKEIIKVGGKRVSPKEIEEVILKNHFVLDCTIIGVDHEVLGEALKAIVIVDSIEDEESLKGMILKECKKKLELYKIPQFFEFSTRMNLKSTGKKM